MKIPNNVRFGTENLRSSVDDINGWKSLKGMSSEESTLNFDGMIKEQNENDESPTSKNDPL